MKKTMGLIFVILMFSGVFFVFSGCAKQDEMNLTDTENLINKLDAHIQTVDNDNKELTVRLYIQAPAMTSWDWLKIKTSDGQIYINEALYDNIVYLQDHEVIYGEAFLVYASALKDIDTDVLENIKEKKTCYMLETKAEKGYGKIAVYEIGTELYFLTFFDNGNVMRVFSTRD